MQNGSSYPAALQKAVEKYYTDDVVGLLTTPNNTLAVEYLKALDETGSEIVPVTIPRKGAAHDGETERDGYASASLLRKKIRAGEDISALAPPLPAGKPPISQGSKPRFSRKSAPCPKRSF